MKIGDRVKFIGCSKEQQRWGGNDEPEGKLVIGGEYIVVAFQEYSWHTKINLEGIDGRFNSVCFDVV